MDKNNVCLILNENESNQLSFIMHEIHSSLNSITSLLRKISESDSIEEIKENSMEASLNADTIRMFLDYWQISNSSSYFEGANMRPINIWRTFNMPNAYFKNLMRKKCINYTVNKENDIPYIDGFPILNAIANILLDNAIKYSPDGNDIVCTFEANHRTNELYLTVENFGPYLKPEEIDNIYSCGSRGDHAQSIGVRGHGYGLNFLSHIIDAHGGEINITSQKDSILNGIPYGLYVCQIILPIQQD